MAIIVSGVLSFSMAFMFADAQAGDHSPKPADGATVAADTPAPPAPESPQPAPTQPRPGFTQLARAVEAIITASGGQFAVSLIELGGAAPSTWSTGGSNPMEAASTYKLPALMAEAQLVAAGKADPAGMVCFEDSDFEAGWFDDYSSGECFSRAVLANRAGIYSDNTAGHMLVRDLGGPAALNSYAAGLGAQSSSFFDVNETTADDLAGLMAAEAEGSAGGSSAQAWLYPNLTHTRYEAGIPAGLPAGTSVVHKTGELDPEVNDVAIVSGGKAGPYVLAVMTDGAGGDAAWGAVAQISAAVWAYEGAR